MILRCPYGDVYKTVEIGRPHGDQQRMFDILINSYHRGRIWWTERNGWQFDQPPGYYDDSLTKDDFDILIAIIETNKI